MCGYVSNCTNQCLDFNVVLPVEQFDNTQTLQISKRLSVMLLIGAIIIYLSPSIRYLLITACLPGVGRVICGHSANNSLDTPPVAILICIGQLRVPEALLLLPYWRSRSHHRSISLFSGVRIQTETKRFQLSAEGVGWLQLQDVSACLLYTSDAADE